MNELCSKLTWPVVLGTTRIKIFTSLAGRYVHPSTLFSSVSWGNCISFVEFVALQFTCRKPWGAVRCLLLCQTSDVATDDNCKAFGLCGYGGLSHRLCADLLIQKRPAHFFFLTKSSRKTLHDAKTMFFWSQGLWKIGKPVVRMHTQTHIHTYTKYSYSARFFLFFQRKATRVASVRISQWIDQNIRCF